MIHITASYDTGVSKTSCGNANKISTLKWLEYDGKCVKACSENRDCTHYTYYPGIFDTTAGFPDLGASCVLYSGECGYTSDHHARATYKKLATNMIHTAVVEVIIIPYIIDDT